MPSRRSFIVASSLSAAASLTDAVPVSGAAVSDDAAFVRLRGALVLSGGGARGSYEAGVIAALVRAAKIDDRVKLPGIDIVCGASIGTLNGWFVATGQYTRLSQVWATIGNEQIFQIKTRYRALTTPSSGVLTRIAQVVLLERGLTTNEQGLLDGERVAQWVRRNVDPTTPLVVPLVFTVTSLARQTGVVYYRLPPYQVTAARASAIAAIHSTVGPDVDVREATDDVLHEAIRASSAIPVFFDAVTLPGPAGPDQFIDGGIADNTPVDVARALAEHIQVILVEPARVSAKRFPSALDVGVAAFGIAQRRVTENALRAAVVETQAKRLLSATTAEAAGFRNALYDVDISYIRPDRALPADLPDFDRQDLMDKTTEVGFADGTRGFQPFRLPNAP